MKHSIILSLVMLFAGITASHAQAFTTAVEYLEFLNKQSEAVTRDMWDYTSSIARSKGARKVENKRKDVLAQISASKKVVQSRPSYKGQDFIKDAFVSYLSLNYDILNDDYEKIVNMEEVAEQSYDEMEAYMLVQDQVNDKMQESSAMLNAEVTKYAADNSITLSEEQSKVSQKLERAGKAFDYYNPIYLIFFKSYIQEATFLVAIESRDLAGAEQAKNALQTTAEEGLEKLKEVKAFEGDGSVKLACMDALKFYLKEATTEFPKTLDFCTKQDTFTKLDAAMKKKKKSEITKADADEFNKAVNEYNVAVKASNSASSSLYDDRTKILNNWNSKVQDFLQKHAA